MSALSASYRTGQLAALAGIHPNTIRLYERWGFLSPAERADSGYRLFTERHVAQLRVVRCVYDYGWLGSELRNASLRVIQAMAVWDLPLAHSSTLCYAERIAEEITVAQETAAILARWARRSHPSEDCQPLTRSQAAAEIGITPEALRNWERNGLIAVPRQGPNHERFYRRQQIERLRIIYMLRQAKYSPNAILRSLQQYDQGEMAAMLPALAGPHDEPDLGLSWTGVGDRWLASLEAAATGAERILRVIAAAKQANV